MSKSAEFNQDTPKPLQVEVIKNLAKGNNCFFQARTRFGKPRISEIFSKIFKKKVMILFFNPFDCLGDNQK
ncbi:hypothetical protein VP01_922g7 [Puccinia sorghi]|uniref:Uncharacterized protein n=1 Tax=Puccinia sorghi TaxID=27349 RepID=A0A0L6U795_9BASI|nr:hypothetical protein VP01_922g7 [Puccinia sorghi]